MTKELTDYTPVELPPFPEEKADVPKWVELARDQLSMFSGSEVIIRDRIVGHRFGGIFHCVPLSKDTYTLELVPGVLVQGLRYDRIGQVSFGKPYNHLNS